MLGTTGRLLAAGTLATALMTGTAPTNAVDVPAHGVSIGLQVTVRASAARS